MPWSGDLYRYAAPRWATEAELLTGAGGLHAGGRWHPIGAFRAVYASLDAETALAESLAHCRRFGLEVRDAMPKTVNAVVARLHSTLDLTNGRIRQRLGLSESRLLAERWWEQEVDDPEALTQAVGRIAREVGLEALLVPSAAQKGGKGIVYFPDNKLPASTLTIVNADQLPRTVP
jgi:RES domain-containing protein